MSISLWSCGGGVQSTAIAALIVQGRLPPPDRAVIADTTRERSSTWHYLETVTAPALEKVGVRIERISAADYANVNIFEGKTLLLPAFVASGSERGGKLINACSSRWKRRVLQRWARAQGIDDADVWLGMSTDEMRRVRLSREGWWRHVYPLIDLGISRADCLDIIKSMGWPPAPKSSCWMCPHMKDEEWIGQREKYPEEYAAAVQLEAEMQAKMPHAFLTKYMKPLSQLDFHTVDKQFPFMQEACDSGYCWA